MMQTLKVSLTLMNAKCQQLVAKRVYPICHECRCISYVSNVLYYICNIDTGILPSRASAAHCDAKSLAGLLPRLIVPELLSLGMAVDLRFEPKKQKMSQAIMPF